MQGHGRGIRKGLMKRAGASIAALCLLTMSVMIAGCGGGGGEGVSSQTVSGVAATGSPLVGEAKIKDSSTPAQEKTTVIGSDGSFAFDVSDMTGPFILRATGHADGETHTLLSFADNPGTANINPLTNAVVASAAGVDDPAEVYERPDHDRLNKIGHNLRASIAEILDKLKPLLRKYNADNSDPVRGDYRADHSHLDGLFDNVKFTLTDGILTIINKKTGAVIFTGKVSDIKNGNFDEDNLPNLSTIPEAPDDVTAVGGTGQVTISWKAVSNATSYNIYWAKTSPVTKTTGKKIAEASRPYFHSGLTAGTKFSYIVTAVNDAGEGEASDQATATTNADQPGTPPTTVPTTAPTTTVRPTTTTTAPTTTVPPTTIPTTAPTTTVRPTTTVPTTISTTVPATTTTVPTTVPATTTTVPTTVPTTVSTTVPTTVPTTIPTTVPATTTVPTTVPATTTTVAPSCGSCHAIPPASGQHSFHVSSRGYACSACHGSGYSSSTVNSATHMNGALTIGGSLSSFNGSTCTNTCHGSRTW